MFDCRRIFPAKCKVPTINGRNFFVLAESEECELSLSVTKCAVVDERWTKVFDSRRSFLGKCKVPTVDVKELFLFRQSPRFVNSRFPQRSLLLSTDVFWQPRKSFWEPF